MNHWLTAVFRYVPISQIDRMNYADPDNNTSPSSLKDDEDSSSGSAV